MFDFDVVTGPTQPPHCHLADESSSPAGAESAPQPASSTAATAVILADPHKAKGENPRS